jgi:hypothetical protein
MSVVMSVLAIFAILLFAAAVIYVLREAVCWYWKVNQAVDSLDRIEGHLAALVKLQRAQLRALAPAEGVEAVHPVQEQLQAG